MECDEDSLCVYKMIVIRKRKTRDEPRAPTGCSKKNAPAEKKKSGWSAACRMRRKQLCAMGEDEQEKHEEEEEEEEEDTKSNREKNKKTLKHVWSGN